MVWLWRLEWAIHFFVFIGWLGWDSETKPTLVQTQGCSVIDLRYYNPWIYFWIFYWHASNFHLVICTLSLHHSCIEIVSNSCHNIDVQEEEKKHIVYIHISPTSSCVVFVLHMCWQNTSCIGCIIVTLFWVYLAFWS